MTNPNDKVIPNFKAETFPNSALKTLDVKDGGLTKREFFAALFMIRPETAAADAVLMADRLIDALNQEELLGSESENNQSLHGDFEPNRKATNRSSR